MSLADQVHFEKWILVGQALMKREKEEEVASMRELIGMS